jgi:hypothetical protein
MAAATVNAKLSVVMSRQAVPAFRFSVARFTDPDNRQA